MNCPRGHGPLLLWDAKHKERSCLNCGYVWYPAVLDPEEAQGEVMTKRGKFRRVGPMSHGVRL